LAGALQARLLWLLVPAVGLLELAAGEWAARRAPTLDEWLALRAAVTELKRPGEPLVIAPEWAEPIARHAFGDELFPLDELGRSHLSGYARVLEVSALGAESRDAGGFRVVSERESGPFTLRVLENPKPVHATYRVLEHAGPRDLDVAVIAGDTERPCTFTDHARVVTGGLHGEVAFPRERFYCGARDGTFVGVTVIDDQRYRPRRCLWAEPPQEGALRLRFRDVPLGSRITGFAGLSYFLYRDGVRKPIELTAKIDGEELGTYRHQDEWGWHAFSFPTGRHAGARRDLELVVVAEHAENRHFCFAAESVQ
jgi:hypothetical protein